MADLTATTPLFGMDPVTRGGLTLSEIDPGPLTSIAPFRGKTAQVSDLLSSAVGMALPGPNRSEHSGTARLIWFGMGQTLLMGVPAPEGLGGMAALTDQSDAWAAVVLSGQETEAALARLVPLDLRPLPFAEDQTARTTLGHLPVSLTRTREGFMILAYRSMAQTLRHDLERAMRAVTD